MKVSMLPSRTPFRMTVVLFLLVLWAGTVRSQDTTDLETQPPESTVRTTDKDRDIKRSFLEWLLIEEMYIYQNDTSLNGIKSNAYHDKMFRPNLQAFEDYILEEYDPELMRLFMELLVVERNSADEFPPSTLSAIFKQYPQKVIELLDEYDNPILWDYFYSELYMFYPASVQFDKNYVKHIVPDVFYLDSAVLFNENFKAKYKEVNFGGMSYGDPMFQDRSRTQTLLFTTYTDWSITKALLFKNEDLPEEFLQYLNLSDDSFSRQEAVSYFNRPFPEGNVVSNSYFTSFKGIQLGDNKANVLSIYGRPDSVNLKDGLEVLFWDFRMTENEDLPQWDGNNRWVPFVLDGLEFYLAAYFRKNRLVALLYSYQVP